MANKELQARIQNKCDSTANWAKATSFVPKKGEIIIYSDGGGGTGVPKMKVGDGSTVVGSLKFIEATMPDASTTVSGIVNTGEQTFGGEKTFKGWTRFITKSGSSYGIAIGAADSSSNYMYLNRNTLGFGVQNASGGSTQTRLEFSNSQIEVRGAIVSSGSNPNKNLGSSDSPWTNGYITNLYGNADTATTASSVANSLSINGKSFNGSAAVDVGVIGAAYGGSGKTTLKDSANAFLEALSEGAYTPSDTAQVVLRTSNLSNSIAFPLTYLWNYIKGKGDSTYQPKGTYLTSIPTASSTTLGGVKIGSGLTVAEDGTISAAAQYTLPAATSTALGGIIAGEGLSITTEGKLSVSKVPNALSVNGKSFDGSAAVDVGVIGAAYGGSGKTTLSASANAFLNSLPYGSTSDTTLTDDHNFYMNSLTGQTNYKVPMSSVYNYVKGKLDSVYAASDSLSAYLPLAGGTMTGTLGFAMNIAINAGTSSDGTANTPATYSAKTLMIGQKDDYLAAHTAQFQYRTETATSTTRMRLVVPEVESTLIGNLSKALTINGTSYDGSAAVDLAIGGGATITLKTWTDTDVA